MKKLLLVLTLVAGFVYAADVVFYISDQDLGAGTLDIYMENHNDAVYGFQLTVIHQMGEYCEKTDLTTQTDCENAGFEWFGFDGLYGGDDPAMVSYGAASGGSAETAGFMVPGNDSGMILGFSLIGTSVPAGEGVLTTVEWDAPTYDLRGYVSLTVTNVSGELGSALSFEIGNAFLGTEETSVISEFALANNFPNPFNPSTQINYDVAQPGDVSIIVYDILGQEVASLVNGYHAPNTYNVKWYGLNNDGNQVATGIYYYKMVSGKFVETKKMMFVK